MKRWGSCFKSKKRKSLSLSSVVSLDLSWCFFYFLFNAVLLQPQYTHKKAVTLPCDAGLMRYAHQTQPKSLLGVKGRAVAGLEGVLVPGSGRRPNLYMSQVSKPQVHPPLAHQTLFTKYKIKIVNNLDSDCEALNLKGEWSSEWGILCVCTGRRPMQLRMRPHHGLVLPYCYFKVFLDNFCGPKNVRQEGKTISTLMGTVR